MKTKKMLIQRESETSVKFKEFIYVQKLFLSQELTT